MNIFKLIDNNENFVHLLNDKTLTKTVKRQKEDFNLLTYCAKKEKWDQFNQIIDFISSQDNKSELTKSVLNIELLVNIRINYPQIKPILDKLPLTIPQENYFLNILSVEAYYKRTNISEEITNIKLRKISTYEEIKFLNENIYNFEENYKFIIETDFNFYLNCLKDVVKNYDKYEKRASLSNNDPNIDKIDEINNKIYNMLIKVTNKEELKQLLLNDVPNFLNEEYKLSKDKNLFTGKSRKTQYLLENVSFNKLTYLADLSKYVIEGHDVEKLLENQFLYFYLEDRKTIDLTQLNNVLIENQFKCINVGKEADITKIVELIKEGTSHVQKIYDLEAEDIGGKELSLNFTFSNCPQGGQASLLPGGNLITYYLSTLKDLGSRHFVHEYSHYLQDRKYFLSNLSYTEKDNKVLNDDMYWESIEKAINQIKSSKEDIIKYSLNSIEHIIPILTEDQKNKIIKDINNNIDNPQYKNVINNTIESIIEGKKELWSGICYIINETRVSEENINYLKDILLLIQESHHQPSFLKSLWKGLDDIKNLVYFSNKFEIHSRLNEMTTGIKSKQDELIWFPTQKMMETIKPHLEKFNKILSNHYNDFVLVESLGKTPTWKKNSSYYSSYLDDYNPTINSKEDSMSAIYKLRKEFKENNEIKSFDKKTEI